jgi:thiazolylpeptide-type bacteriocin precursor
MDKILGTAAHTALPGHLLSLAEELQALESETFEIRDYTDANEMLELAGSTSTSSCSTSSSTTSSCSTSSTCSS